MSMTDHELDTLESRIFGSEHSSTVIERNRHDVGALNRLGKKQELKRRFGFVSLFGFSCTILITWESALAVFAQVFDNGGPAGLAWGFPIAWLCGTSVFMVISELASIAPIAGGQYFWVAMLASRPYRRFYSYIAGWLTTLAWISTLGTSAVFIGVQIQGLIILNNDDYTSKTWHGTLLSFCVVAVALFVNTVVAGLLPFLEGIILFVHIMGFIATLITLVYLSPHQPASAVFFQPLNEGGWPTMGLAYCVGFIGNVATFIGADAAVHMAEEIENAAMNVPRAIVSTLLINGTAGYAIVLALLFCLNDVESALYTKTGFPYIQVYADNIGNAGATVLTCFVVFLGLCGVAGAMATASRMVWSFARDRGLPFHRHIAHVSTLNSVPVVAVIVVTVIPCLLALIYIGSTAAFTNIVSLSVSGLYSSYFVPCALLLYRRLKGQIKPYDADLYSSDAMVSRLEASDVHEDDPEVLELPLMWGPWRIPGVLGLLNNILACVYCIFVFFWCFWPPVYDVTVESMNWSVLVYGFSIGFAIVYYFAWGRRQYKGPLIDRSLVGQGSVATFSSSVRRESQRPSPKEEGKYA